MELNDTNITKARRCYESPASFYEVVFDKALTEYQTDLIDLLLSGQRYPTVENIADDQNDHNTALSAYIAWLLVSKPEQQVIYCDKRTGNKTIRELVVLLLTKLNEFLQELYSKAPIIELNNTFVVELFNKSKLVLGSVSTATFKDRVANLTVFTTSKVDEAVWNAATASTADNGTIVCVFTTPQPANSTDVSNSTVSFENI